MRRYPRLYGRGQDPYGAYGLSADQGCPLRHAAAEAAGCGFPLRWGQTGGGPGKRHESTNVGAIFRSAAALGMDAVLLTPGCSDPLYRRAARVSMGTVFQVPWTFFDRQQCPWPERGMEALRELGFKTAAMALKKDSVSIGDPALLAEERLAVVLGTEGDGLAAETIADCDYTVMIPMAHGVDSLNVAAASAVAFWELGKR